MRKGNVMAKYEVKYNIIGMYTKKSLYSRIIHERARPGSASVVLVIWGLCPLTPATIYSRFATISRRVNAIYPVRWPRQKQSDGHQCKWTRPWWFWRLKGSLHDVVDERGVCVRFCLAPILSIIFTHAMWQRSLTKPKINLITTCFLRGSPAT